MTAPVSGSSATNAAGTTAASSGTLAKLNKDQFLSMLVAQLRNQDPMSPMQGTEFAAQLAQFSSLEQLIQLGQKVDAQTTAQADSQAKVEQSAQTTLGASMLGRSVLVDGSQMTVGADGVGSVTADLAGAAANVTVRVLDSQHVEVARQSFTSVPGGRQSLTFGGVLPPGSYTYDVSATNTAGGSVAVHPYTTATVDGMSVDKSGQILLRVGGSLIPMSQIVEFRAATPASH
jgi:flagellar basal-body rod modification protein FlgD